MHKNACDCVVTGNICGYSSILLFSPQVLYCFLLSVEPTSVGLFQKFPFIMGGGGSGGAVGGGGGGAGGSATTGCAPPTSGRGVPPHLAANSKPQPPPKMKPRNEDKKATPVFV